MAETVLEFKFSYENAKSFKLEKQQDSGGWETVIEVDENTHIAAVWPFIKSLCEKTFELELEAISVIMKS